MLRNKFLQVYLKGDADDHILFIAIIITASNES